jgi:hypothetical protein
MTTTPIIPTPVPQDKPRSPRRRWILPAAIALVTFGAGLGIGLVTGSNSAQVAQDQQQIRADNGRINAQRGQLAGAQGQLQNARSSLLTAQDKATNAVSSANQAAQAKYASRMASANALLRKLRGEQQVVNQNTISSDGVYVVGQDIAPGVYHTSGAGGSASSGGACYYATLNSDNTSDISDNNNFNGPETVDVSGAHAFQISGGCTWTKIG